MAGLCRRGRLQPYRLFNVEYRVKEAIQTEVETAQTVAPANVQPMAPPPEKPRVSRNFHCQCGEQVFFRNTQCLACHSALGFEPLRAQVKALVPGPRELTWQLHDQTGARAPLYRRCTHLDTVGCNWLLAEADVDAHGGRCRACRLNRTIPDLAVADNQRLWRLVEVAKRRLVSQLIGLGLPVRSKVTEDPAQGLMFDLLRGAPHGPQILTGHEEGLITLDVEEADDAKREQVRSAMHEPYRTLLGHFRHEVGHYYWNRLVRDTQWLQPFRFRFGDERFDYASALQQHYNNGPLADWPQSFVSAYASVHPWEDWAETWAHYLHMVDSVDTALSFGLRGDALLTDMAPFGPEALDVVEAPDAAPFLALVNAWLGLSTLMNELARGMGQQDFYPFVLSRPAVAKLHFVHRVVGEAVLNESARTAAPARAA
jgi:hypothetical protein